MSWQKWSVLPVWVLTVVGAVVVGLVSPADERLTWLAIALAAAIIATFAIQLATGQIEGYVGRAIASICGAIVILAVATGVFALVQ